MKKWIFYILFILAGSNCFAQTPEFEFQLYFEDAVGNKDTVTLGYDALATDSIDTAFGEVDILNQPWGDSLDMRVGDLTYDGTNVNQISWLTPNTYFTKKQILNSYCDKGFDKSARVSISFKLNNLPITMSWGNRDTFYNNFCAFASSFYTIPYELGEVWMDAGMTRIQPSIMAFSGILNIDWHPSSPLTTLYFSDNIGTPYYDRSPIPTYIDNGDTIGIFQFVFWKNDTTTTNTEKMEALSNIQIFPNPAINTITIDLSKMISSPIDLFVYQLDGTLFESQKLGNVNNVIDISGWNNGIYFFKITNGDGLSVTKKIIKN